MTIDLSQLPQEKQVFLKAHPDLLKSLERAIPRKAGRVQKRREKRRKTEPAWRRGLEDVDRRVREARSKADTARRRADELRQKYVVDPNLRDIQSKLMRKLDVVIGDKDLVCPVCGEHNGAYTKGKPNKINGRPSCLKCKVPLVPKNKVAEWLKSPRIKVLRRSLKDELKRLNPEEDK